MRIFGAVMLKEFLSFLRSWGLVAVVLYSFSFDIYIAGQGITVKPQFVKVGYVDKSGGLLSQKILSHLHMPQFQKPIAFLNAKDLQQAIFDRSIMVGIIFEEDFERDLYKNGHTKLDILLDSTAASQSFVTLSYLEHTIFDMQKHPLPIQLKLHKLFNQNADSKMFMSLAELLSISTLLSVILAAMVFVKEKEDGTWDMMLLMPVDAKIIILAKALSQVCIVLGGIIIAVGFVILGIFHTPLNGSFWDFFALSLLFSLTSAGIGLFIAAIAQNIMQVAQLAILIMMPLIFLSGAWTPIYAMPPFIQKLSLLSPLRYYIEGTISIFFRGTQGWDLLHYFVALFILGVVLFAIGFRKIGRLF